MRVKLFQVVKEVSLWAVFAVNGNDPNDRELVQNWTDDERFAIDMAATLNRIAATHRVESGKAREGDLGEELSPPDELPIRSISLEDI